MIGPVVPVGRPVRATVFVGRWPTIPFVDTPEIIEPGTFLPTTATLVSGASEAVLIDALCLEEDVKELGDLIERTGKRLTTIFITHGHADHYLGASPLLERFPGATLVATAEVIESMKESLESQARQWGSSSETAASPVARSCRTGSTATPCTWTGHR